MRGQDKYLKCWSCSAQLRGDLIRADGVINSRNDRYGGPFYLYLCSECGIENMCEYTAQGTFFASPPFRPTIADWLLEKLGPGSTAESFLKISAWFEREEDRRRFVFEREGDFRYSSFIERIKWSFFRRRREIPDVEEKQLRSAPASPYEILGVRPGSTDAQIKKAFHKMIRKHHPDKVHHLGPEKVRRAEELFKQLLEAYEALGY